MDKVLIKKVADEVVKFIGGKTSRLFALFYGGKAEEAEKELSNIRKTINARAFFRTDIKNFFERKRPDVISFRISFPIKVEFNGRAVYPVVEGEAILSSNGRYNIVNSIFSLICEEKDGEIEIETADINEFPDKVKRVLASFLDIIMCSSYSDLKQVIPSW